MSDERDERIEVERPLFYTEDKPLLYRADGTPLRRQIGFTMQTSGTFPALSDNTKKTLGGKKKGKK